MIRSIRFASAAAALTFVALAAGCENTTDPPPQTAQNQYPPQGYPQQQYPQQQYPGQPYPQQQYPQQQYPQQPYPQQQYPQQPQPYPTQTAPAPTQTAPASTVPGFPGLTIPTLPGFPAPGGTQPAPGGTAPAPGQPQQPGQATGAATPIDPTLASAATGPLFLLAQTEAPGMQKEGPVVAGNFQAGQSLEQQIQLSPGKCYTVLAVGVGITEMDVSLVLATPLPGMSPVLAQDSGTGATASLGGRGNCYKWSAPLASPAKFVMVARSGQGIAAGQLYVK